MLTITPDPLVVGGQATIKVSGSSRAGETITVDIDDGEGHTDSVQITLNGEGEGQTTWTVPNWEQAKFNYSTCEEVARDITSVTPQEDPAATDQSSRIPASD